MVAVTVLLVVSITETLPWVASLLGFRVQVPKNQRIWVGD